MPSCLPCQLSASAWLPAEAATTPFAFFSSDRDINAFRAPRFLKAPRELELLVLQEDVAAAELAEPVRVRDRRPHDAASYTGGGDGDVLEEHGQSSGHGAARMRWASFCSQSLGLQQAMHCALVCGVLSDAQHCCGLLRSAVYPVQLASSRLSSMTRRASRLALTRVLRRRRALRTMRRMRLSDFCAASVELVCCLACGSIGN